MNNRKLHIITLFFFMFFLNETKSQSVGVTSVTVRFDQMPSTYHVEKSALRYNKDFAFGMHLDDGNKDIYTHAYPLLNGGSIGTTSYPGLYYTDGCGNDIAFKMSSSIFSFEQGGTIDGHDPNGPYADQNVTWPELIEMYEDGWGVYNHGLTSSNADDPYYSIRRNHSYVKRKMLEATPGGPEMKVFVNPNGDESFTTPAFNEDYIVAYRQYSFGVPSFDVTTHVFGDSIKMGRTSLEGGTSLSDLVDDMAAQSVNGAHHFGATFSHSVTGGFGYSFPVFRAHMNYIASEYGKDGEDNVWMTTEEEILEYCMISEDITVDTVLIGTDLIITFDGILRTDLRYYALSLLVTADENIDTVFIDGGTNNTYNGIGNDTSLINLEWDGYVPVADTVNAEYYVSIAEQTRLQTDWNIAMDYVEIVPPGDTKEAFRDRLCAIPGITFPTGYCFCTTDVTPDTTICDGECVTLTAEVGVSYEWSTGDTTQSIDVCPDTTTQYFVTVYNQAGCPATDSVTVTVAPLPNANAGNDTTICSGTCAQLTATGGISYDWSTGDTTQTIEVCPPDTNEYFVTVTSSDSCSSEDSVMVNVIESPIANAGNDTSICLGECVVLTASGGDSIVWSTGDTSWSIEVCPQDTTAYIATVTANNGCQDSDTVEVFVLPLPVPEAGNDTSICKGDTAILTAYGGVQYVWSTQDSTQTIYVSPEDTTEYLVTVTNIHGCSAEDSVMVNILPTPTPVINSGNDTIICLVDCITLSINYSDSILWSTGDTTREITVCPGNKKQYWVDVTNENGCTGTDTILVDVSFPPTAEVGPDTTICEGRCATLNASGGSSYEWDHGDTTAVVVVCPETTRWFGVNVYNEIGCMSRDSAKVTVNPKPDLTVSADTGVCNGNCIEIEASGAETYLWSTDETSPQIEVCPDVPTMYYVEGWNELNCSANDSVFVTIYDNPITNLPHDTSICQGDCITLTSQEGSEFFWSTGETTQSITVCPEDETTYYLTAVNIHECVTNDSSRVRVKAKTDSYIYNFIPAFCQNEDSVRLYGYPAGGFFLGPGVIPYGENFYFFPAMPSPGPHNIIYAYTNQLNCTSFDTAIVYIYETPIVDIGSDTTVCNNEFLTLQTKGDYDTYLWSNGDTGPTTTILPGDLGIGLKEFGIIVTKDGCTGMDDITLNVIVCNPGIHEYYNSPEISIYPNPAKDKIVVFIDGEEKEIKMDVIDIHGNLVYSKILVNTTQKNYSIEIQVGFLNKGIYLIKFHNGNFIKILKLNVY